MLMNKRFEVRSIMDQKCQSENEKTPERLVLQSKLIYIYMEHSTARIRSMDSDIESFKIEKVNVQVR